MSILSDTIEKFIKAMLSDEADSVDLKRNELAQYFSCAPSQINYVIKTRFNINQGYHTESRRGGGGYIRIIKVDSCDEDYLMHLLQESIGGAITQREAVTIIAHLLEQGIIAKQTAEVMRAAVQDKAMMVPINFKDIIRAGILKSMITTILIKCGKKD
jgi:transcriptional regulator CtsR